MNTLKERLSAFTAIVLIVMFSQNLFSSSSINHFCIDADDYMEQSNIIFDCITSPVLICPPGNFSCPGSSTLPDHTGYATAYAGPDCPDPIVTFTDEVVMDTSCILKIHRKWRAEYPAGTANPWLYSECIQIIEQTDTLAPVAVGLPADTTLYGNGMGCSVFFDWTDPTYEDDCGVASIMISHPNGYHFPEGTTEVSYILGDFCGNVDTSFFLVTVECLMCSSPPIIHCPADFMQCPADSIPGPDVTGYATAIAGHQACSTPLISYTDTIISSGPCLGQKVIERVWTAVDPDVDSLTSSCTQLISLIDTLSPSFYHLPADITVTSTNANCTAVATWTEPTIADNCGIDTIYSNYMSGDHFYDGVTPVIYTIVDNCGNHASATFNVTVECQSCQTAPIIHCPPDKWLCIGSSTSPYYTGSASATGGDHCPYVMVTYQDWIVSTGPCSGQKIIKRVWTASYQGVAGLSSSCTQYLYLEDNSAPVLYNCPSDIVLTTQNPVAYWTVPSAYDNCSGVNITSNYSPGSVFPPGTTTVVYTATDLCGNSSTCSFKVTVTSPPQPLECPDDIYLTCNSPNGVFVDWDPPTYDGYCGNCNGGQYIPGFIYMGSWNGHEYYCSTSPASWNTARQICASNGGYLASIGSAEENYFLANILTLQSAWIGLNDKAWEGEYTWDSGESYGYTNWYPGQPNDHNGQQDCVEMLNSGHWNDQYCHYSLEFIMELPCGNVEQIGGPSPGSYLQAGSYTVTYKVNDACSYNNTCSFEINISGGLNISCPQDIVVTPPAGSNNVQVNWSEPTYSTCCGQCSNGSNYIPGFVYMGSLNGHHYYCSTQSTTWPAAQANCAALGGNLAVINSAAENNFLATNLTTQNAWIGLSDFASEGHFSWVNGDPLTYTNWYPGQPNNYGSGQDYVELMNTGYWNDQYNSTYQEYILELSNCVQVNQLSGPQPGAVLPANSQYTVVYEVSDGCGNNEICSFDITVEGSNNFNYCLANGADAYEYHIQRVQFANLDNISANDGGYEDYTNFCAEVEANTSYLLSLTPGDLSNSGELKYWRVWIDYNEDGDFFDAGEMVAYGSGTAAIAGMVTIPSNVGNGETRMRVIMSLDRYPQSPCEQFPFGEVEDYCILTKDNFNAPGSVDKRSELLPVKLEAQAHMVQLYPNPAYELLNIEFEASGVAQNINVLDIQGRQIQTINRKLNNKLIKLDVSQLAEGLYFLDIQYKDGSEERRKFIVQK